MVICKWSRDTHIGEIYTLPTPPGYAPGKLQHYVNIKIPAEHVSFH